MSTTSLLTELTAIRDEHGQLTPALVVDAARNPEHPLHSRFEWDDTLAAEQWRLEQAGQLLRIVKLPPEEGRPRDLRAFVAIKGKDSHRSDYVPTEVALSDPLSRDIVLRAMKREWQTFRRRYDHMVEFAAFIIHDIEKETA